MLLKLHDPNCLLSAEKEIKSLIVNEIDEGEKLQVLINCIGDDREAVSKGKSGKQ